MQLIPVDDHKGLRLKQSQSLTGKVIAVVGINGAGKSRLLESIFEGKIQVLSEGLAILHDQIVHLTTATLQPNISFGFDPMRYRDEVRTAKAFYVQHREKFSLDPQQTMAAIGPLVGRMGTMGSGVNTHVLAHVAITASKATNKDVNALNDEDIADYYSSTVMTQLGSLNVTSTMLEYLQRQEENELNACRNLTFGRQLSYWNPEEFQLRFGPPPWELFNGFLTSVFNGKYHVEPPVMDNSGGYEAHLRRADGTEIPPNFLSSGEKTLLWLSLCTYSAGSRRVGRPPKLLLLDEPDATLHPQMIQKLHSTLNKMAQEFNCVIIFTTHSPTTIALFGGAIYQIEEDELLSVERDVAIGELLVGVDQVSIDYSNRRQVYVESSTDAEIYSAIFQLLKQSGQAQSHHISLSFIPAAPKLSIQSLQQILRATLGSLDPESVAACLAAINGQGSCAQVVGSVEALSHEENNTVYGIVDWDMKNEPRERIHVLGPQLFYSIESAILNPLTLGLYLVDNYAEERAVVMLGLDIGFDRQSLYLDCRHWQSIADAVTKRVLSLDEVRPEVECVFLNHCSVNFDKRYVHMNGHELESRIRGNAVYPFLNAFTKRPTLMLDVVRRGIHRSHGRSLPLAFKDIFGAIQLAR